jgi:hypothetical protein
MIFVGLWRLGHAPTFEAMECPERCGQKAGPYSAHHQSPDALYRSI